MNLIKFSIVIPTYNHCDDLLRPCLESLRDYTFLNHVEVIVVANGCTDNTRSYLESLKLSGYPIEIVWSDEPLGYTKATNLGMKKAIGKYVILMNNDITLLHQSKGQWLAMLERPFLQDPKTGISGPVKFSWDCGGIERTAMAFWLVMIKRDVIDRIGYLNEIFSPGMGEDGDYCIRAEQAGFRLASVPQDITGRFEVGIVNHYFPVYHKGNGTFADNEREKTDVIERNIKILEQMYGKKVKYSIIIPTSKNFDVALRPCVENLLKYTNLDDKEVIVIANGAPPQSRDFLEALRGRVQYVWSDEPTGVIKAYNTGINKARGEFIILIDDDSILMKQPIDAWVDILRKPFTDPTVGASSPFANEYENMGLVLHSGCTMYRADLLRQVGMFDEIYNPGYFSDSDVAMKIWRAGFKCVEVPEHMPNKEYNNGVFKVMFPVIHTGEVQTMNKQKDVKILERNREILYSRYGKKQMEETSDLDAAYEWCLKCQTDISEHLETLRKYASECQHITEFGTRGVYSTYAFMVARPKKLLTYDIVLPGNNIWVADSIAKQNNIEFAFMERDTTTCDVIEETDLLFIDTLHTKKQLALELARHSSQVRKYIILHDTVTFGTVGEDGVEGNGLMPAVEEFLQTNTDWVKREQYYYCNGLLVLERKRQ